MIFLYVTFPHLSVAKKAARIALNKGLAGCINIFPIESMFCEKEKIINKKEIVVIFKALTKNIIKLEKSITESHPYKVPCLARIDISKINKNYLNWLKNSCN